MKTQNAALILSCLMALAPAAMAGQESFGVPYGGPKPELNCGGLKDPAGHMLLGVGYNLVSIKGELNVESRVVYPNAQPNYIPVTFVSRVNSPEGPIATSIETYEGGGFTVTLTIEGSGSEQKTVSGTLGTKNASATCEPVAATS